MFAIILKYRIMPHLWFCYLLLKSEVYNKIKGKIKIKYTKVYKVGKNRFTVVRKENTAVVNSTRIDSVPHALSIFNFLLPFV